MQLHGNQSCRNAYNANALQVPGTLGHHTNHISSEVLNRYGSAGKCLHRAKVRAWMHRHHPQSASWSTLLRAPGGAPLPTRQSLCWYDFSFCACRTALDTKSKQPHGAPFSKGELAQSADLAQNGQRTDMSSSRHRSQVHTFTGLCSRLDISELCPWASQPQIQGISKALVLLR